MFHGWARRPGASYPLLQYAFGDSLGYPLEVVRNFFRPSEIFQPNANLIVSERVKELLRGVANIEFLRVGLKTVFSVPYSLAKEIRPALQDEADLASRFQHDAELLARLGDWFELIIPHYARIEAPAAAHRRSYAVPSELSASPLRIELAAADLDRFPVLWNDGILIREDVLARVEGALDSAFFVRELIALR